MTGGAPQGKRNCVLRCDSGTVSKNRDCSVNRSTLWQVNGVLDSATNVTGGGSLVKLLEKSRGAAYLGRGSLLPPARPRGGSPSFAPRRFPIAGRRRSTTF